MKKVSIALSVAGFCALISNGYADEGLSIYGKANLSLNKVEIESETSYVDEWQLNSNASRLGVKGSYEIGEGIEAIYQLEYEVHFDDGSSSSKKDNDTFEQRNIFAGFKGGFGSVIAGKHDTPLKLAQGKVDRFNDQVQGDIKYYMEGEDRADNIVMYSTPVFSGLSAKIAIIPGENSTGESSENNISDGESVSISYKNDWVSASVARNNDVDSQDVSRIAANFTISNTALGLLFQTTDSPRSSSGDEESVLLSVTQKIGSGWMLKAQYGRTQYDIDTEDTQFAFGIDKKLNKSAKVFAYYAKVNSDRFVTVIPEARSDFITGTTYDNSNVAVGYEIKF